MTKKTRPLDSADRAFLEDAAELFKNRSAPFEIVMTVLGSTVWGGLLLWIGWRVLAWLLTFVPATALWASTANFNDDIWAVFGFAAVCSSVYILRFETLVRKRRMSALAQIRSELDHDEVEEEDVIVEAIKCFQEPEHLMKIYLLHLDDGRTRVRYDYESVDTDGTGKSPRTDFPISRELTMVYFKQLGEIRYDFGPTKIRKPRAKPLDLDLGNWPEDETWLDIAWEDVDALYAGSVR